MKKQIIPISLIIFSFLISFSNFYGQDTTKVGTARHSATYTIENGDTIPTVFIQEFEYKDPDFARQWNRTVYFARRMYTYCEIIDSTLKKLDKEKEQEKNTKGYWTRRKKRRGNKRVKKDLFKEYKYEIKNLTNTRGDYLTKMIHRKTGITTYNLIKKYKNGRTAWFYNSLLYMYGSTDLKNKFDPKEDWMLKLVLQDIESGKIMPISRIQQIYEIRAREVRDKARKEKKRKKKKKNN